VPYVSVVKCVVVGSREHNRGPTSHHITSINANEYVCVVSAKVGSWCANEIEQKGHTNTCDETFNIDTSTQSKVDKSISK